MPATSWLLVKLLVKMLIAINSIPEQNKEHFSKIAELSTKLAFDKLSGRKL